MSNNIGYFVNGGNFQGTNPSIETAFTGGVLIPPGVKPSIIYDKLKLEVFPGGLVTGLKSNEAFQDDIVNLYNVTFDKGLHTKYTSMDPKYKDRFDKYLWWSFEEITQMWKLKAKSKKLPTLGMQKSEGETSKDESSETYLDSNKALASPTLQEVVGSNLTVKTSPLVTPRPQNFKIRVEENGEPIITISSTDVEQDGNTSMETSKIMDAVFKMAPNMMMSIVSLQKEIHNIKEGERQLLDEKFNNASQLISLNSELTVCKDDLSRAKKEVLTLKEDLSTKESVYKVLVDKLDNMEIEITKDIKKVNTNVERLVNIQGHNINYDQPNKNTYSSTMLSFNTKLNIFMSEKLNTRPNQSNIIPNYEWLCSNAGPINSLTCPGADLESFLGKLNDTKLSLGTGGLAVFMVEVPKGQSNKPGSLREIKVAAGVSYIDYLINSVSSLFKTPLFIAILPCRDEDLTFGMELESAFNNCDAVGNSSITIIWMNSLLNRDQVLAKKIVCPTGRAHGLAGVRTISEILISIHKTLSLDSPAPIPCACGALCSEICMAIQDTKPAPSVKKETVAATITELPIEEVTNWKYTPSYQSKHPRFCWICGGSLDSLPHVRRIPCKPMIGKCNICHKEGHYAKVHYVTDEDDKSAMMHRYGPQFTFPYTAKKEEHHHQPIVKKPKTSILSIESDED